MSTEEAKVSRHQAILDSIDRLEIAVDRVGSLLTRIVEGGEPPKQEAKARVAPQTQTLAHTLDGTAGCIENQASRLHSIASDIESVLF